VALYSASNRMTTPGAGPLLEVRGISKRFGAHAALADVTLTLLPGEVHAVAGENGAGKSTLMAILSGGLRPDAGELIWEGRPVVLGDVRSAQALGISMVHQEPQLVGSLSVAENVGLGRLPVRGGPFRVVDRGRLRDEARRALALVRADLPPERRVETLGVAERQLVAIARALHFGARLIILDEPTSSLSMAETESLFVTLRALRERGTAIVYISHRLEELRALADRVTVLRDGRVVTTAPLAQTSNDALILAMSGRDLATVDAARDERAAGEVLLEVRGVGRRGRLHDVSLEVRSGEIVGLAGLVGAGRSRLLRTVFGADRADAGEVRVRAADGSWRRVGTLRDAVAAGVGLVPEDRRALGLVPVASVADNIGLVTPPGTRRFGMLRRGRLREFAARAVETLRIKARSLDAPVRTLSGGNQQKCVLGRWVGPEARVLLLDEPTRGVDVGAKAEIHRHLRELARRGLAILIASSELPELLALCDRIAVMRQGRLVSELPRGQATAPEVLRLATGTR
jgi:ABC-type sugar transport system ATPase subunit